MTAGLEKPAAYWIAPGASDAAMYIVLAGSTLSSACYLKVLIY